MRKSTVIYCFDSSVGILSYAAWSKITSREVTAIPRAHGMMLRSDMRVWRNDKVCRADLFHLDRPQYYISEREYFELKRQQLAEM